MGRLHRRLWARAKGEVSGQALVEFAIVAPLLVMVLLFAIWFYELVTIKLKVQEAARYAAWEATAYPLHNYGDDPIDADRLTDQIMSQLPTIPSIELPGGIGNMVGIPDISGMAQQQVQQAVQEFSERAVEVLGEMPPELVQAIAGNAVSTNRHAQEMIGAVQGDAMSRYANMDSANPTRGRNTFLAANWTPPVVLMSDRAEPRVPGGEIANLILRVGGGIYDFIDSFNYQNTNYVAQSLIASSSENTFGGALQNRTFGPASWGFNTNGDISATVALAVENTWFNRGVGRFIMPDETRAVVFTERTSVLADSWRLNQNEDVYGSVERPGLARGTAYWKQVDRMYFINQRTRAMARLWITNFRTMMRGALGAISVATNPPNLTDEDFVSTAVVSRPYGVDENGASGTEPGRSRVVEDVGPRTYDTAPVGLTGAGSEKLRAYGQTLMDRGPHYMGCQRQMSLGCPTATLQQDNPFGGYVIYEGGGTTN